MRQLNIFDYQSNIGDYKDAGYYKYLPILCF